ncbi:four helix bundle protein [Poriferisphaera sp. WC338]|uniref:four helix bundle protein n=1 Tax=Poriferisphaera sp. WC338 TaxID=3425129 RepID=UPI003D814504
MGRDHRKLKAFQAADELVVATFKETSNLPEDETHGLVQQMRTAAVAVASNIVNGCARPTMREYMHFLNVSFGALREVGYLIELSYKLEYLDEEKFERMNDYYDEAAKLLAGLIRSYKENRA